MSALDKKLGLEDLSIQERIQTYQRLIIQVHYESMIDCEDCAVAMEDSSIICVTHTAAEFALTERYAELTSPSSSTPSPPTTRVAPVFMNLTLQTDPAHEDNEEETDDDVICLGEQAPSGMRKRSLKTIPENREVIELD